jgi:hypothetical protein
MDRTLKRLNEREGMEIVKEIHDCELTREDPDEYLMWLCKRLSKLVEARHKREDRLSSLTPSHPPGAES